MCSLFLSLHFCGNNIFVLHFIIIMFINSTEVKPVVVVKDGDIEETLQLNSLSAMIVNLLANLLCFTHRDFFFVKRHLSIRTNTISAVGLFSDVQSQWTLTK